jgi:hypothetical protein
MVRSGTLERLRVCIHKQSPPAVRRAAFDVLETLSEHRQIGRALACERASDGALAANGLIADLLECTPKWVKRFSQKELDDMAYDNAEEVQITREQFGKGRMGQIDYEAAVRKQDDARRQREAERAAATPPARLAQNLRIVRRLCATPHAAGQALREGAVGRCVRLLSHPAETVRAQACALLQALTLGEEGRRQAIDTGVKDVAEGALLTTGVKNKVKGGTREGAMLALKNLCLGGARPDPLASIRRAAMGTIACMVVDLDGKECLLNVDTKLDLVIQGMSKERDNATKEHALNVCATMACSPEAREKLLSAGAVEIVERAAKYAVDERQDAMAAAALEALLFEP